MLRDVRLVRMRSSPPACSPTASSPKSGRKARPSWRSSPRPGRSMVEQERLDAPLCRFRERIAPAHCASAGAPARFVQGKPALLYWPGLALFVVVGCCWRRWCRAHCRPIRWAAPLSSWRFSRCFSGRAAISSAAIGRANTGPTRCRANCCRSCDDRRSSTQASAACAPRPAFFPEREQRKPQQAHEQRHVHLGAFRDGIVQHGATAR